jgi:endoglucanase
MKKPAKTSVFAASAIVVVFGLTFAAAAEPNAASMQSDAFKMNKLLGRGVNLSNALEAPNEGDWGVKLKEEYFDIIRQAGFNSIRLPVRWSGHALTEKPYTIDPNFFKRVDWAVNCALSRNMSIIVNVQQYAELYTDPLPHKERFIALWRQIAEHYKDYPDKLFIELFNEPDDAFTPEIWNDFVKETIPVIRESNPKRMIIVDSANDAWPSYLKLLKLPENDRNIIVSIHYYFPLEFTHQGSPWITPQKIASFLKDMEYIRQSIPSKLTVGDSNAWMGTKWTGSDAEKKEITDAFDAASAWGKENNRPINLGEFGSYRKADMESRVRWTKFIADTAARRDMSLLCWDFCAEFGLYDRGTKSWHKPLLDAIIPPK